MSAKVEVRFKCKCMTDEAVLAVPARRRDEDVIIWMNQVVQPSIYLDHRMRSPQCEATEMEFAKVFLPENAEFIGQAQQEH